MDSKTAVKQLKSIEAAFLSSENERPRLAAGGWNENWQTLIAIILSAQTRDTTTIKICEKLYKKYPSIYSLSRARLPSIEKIIRPVNYHRTKSKHVKKTACILSEAEVPDNLKGLLKLPGVGRKTANVYLAEVHKKPAIGVDTHVARISGKLGWTKNRDPKKIEEDLMKLFPEKYWSLINHSLVCFGQTYGRKKDVENRMLSELL